MLPLAYRNLRRQTKRTFYTALAMIVAVSSVTFLDAYMGGFMDNYFQTFIQLDAGHVKVIPGNGVGKTRPLPLEDGLQNLSELLGVVRSIPEVETASPRIRFPVLLDKPDGVVPALGIALTPSLESNLMDLASMLSEGRLPQDSTFEIALGSVLAEELGLSVGDELFMVASNSYGGLGPGLYTVAGIITTGIRTLDRKQFYVPLFAAQDQLVMDDAAMEIVCRVSGPLDAAPSVAAEINNALTDAGFSNVVAVPWQQQSSIASAMQPAEFFVFIMMLLFGLIAVITVINTVLMSVIERTGEIGMLRAIGFERKTVIQMIVSESVLIGIFATLVGLIVGMGISLILAKTGIHYGTLLDDIDMPIKPVVYPNPSLMIAMKAAIFGLVVSLISAWYPARVATRLQPVEALRNLQ